MIRAAYRSPRAGYTGKLVEADPRLPVTAWGGDIAPQGLFINLESGKGANLEIAAGTDGGGTVFRKITLPPGGVWLSCIGWTRVTVTVTSVSASDVEVSASWLRESPDRQRLFFVEQLNASGVAAPIPFGARRLAVSAVPAGFTWLSQPAGAALNIPANFTAVGTFADVCGLEYVNNVANVVGCWEIDPL